MMSDNIMDRLRNDTKTAHQQLEKVTIPYIKKATDDQQYAVLLHMFYGYFKQVETRIHALVDKTLLPDIEERRQSAALEDDLKIIGNTAPLVLSHEIPNLQTVPQALGAMYVLEGSTLGGQHISKMLAKQLNRTAENGISFFSGYGAATMGKWGIFTAMMNEYAAQHPLLMNEIVAAADETFEKFGVWVAHFEAKQTAAMNS